MAKKKNGIIALLVVSALILAGLAYVFLPIDLTAEEMMELQNFYEASEAECKFMDDIGAMDEQEVVDAWSLLTDMEFDVNNSYMKLNDKQKRYARFHSVPPVFRAETE